MGGSSFCHWLQSRENLSSGERTSLPISLLRGDDGWAVIQLWPPAVFKYGPELNTAGGDSTAESLSVFSVASFLTAFYMALLMMAALSMLPRIFHFRSARSFRSFFCSSFFFCCEFRLCSILAGRLPLLRRVSSWEISHGSEVGFFALFEAVVSGFGDGESLGAP